jgi:hypothetical protein
MSHLEDTAEGVKEVADPWDRDGHISLTLDGRVGLPYEAESYVNILGDRDAIRALRDACNEALEREGSTEYTRVGLRNARRKAAGWPVEVRVLVMKDGGVVG